MRRAKQQVVMLAFALLMLTSANLQSQKQPDPKAAQQEVPDNPLKPLPPKQPITFSHKLHSEQDISCESCHTNPSPGNAMTLPATSTCMGCHQSIATDRPAIKKLADYARTEQPIPWVRVYVVRPGLRWSHAVHLQAGKTCVACHSNVAQMDQMAEVTSVTTMYSCLSCHQKNQAKSECKTCHVWP
jgi:hypothetical protein